MDGDRRCKNYPRCNRLVERERPNQSRYCERCGASRSRDWKREHPERAKLYDSQVAVDKWRECHPWNEYIQDWRKTHAEKYREQNTNHVRAHRERRRQRRRLYPVVLVILTSAVLLATAARTFAGGSETMELSVQIDLYDHLLIKFTVACGLTLFCVRILMKEMEEALESFEAKARKRKDKKKHQ